jgi:serine/threonine protein kinase
VLPRGTIVAGYRVDGVVGEGGMAVVYRATQLSLNRVVALKVLPPALSEDLGFRTRFQREGQLQAGLDHDHIVPVYEAGQTERGLFLAMRLIEGPTLKGLILTHQLDPRRSLRLLAQVARALDAAHAQGLIHRDIKPQNILIDSDDHAYLADFGLIKAPDDVRLTGTGQFIGTIDYVAPEQIQGEPPTSASDCYALTGVLFECLTGEVPFPKPNEAATLHAHMLHPPPKLTERRPELPAALDDVIARGMAKDPGTRPASAVALIEEASLAFASASPHTFAPAPASDAGESDGLERDQTTRIRARPPS